MSRMMYRFLLSFCVLLAATGAASGQEKRATDKRVAIRQLLEAGDAARQSQLIFEKMLDRFEEPFAASMIAGLRAEGHFKPLSAEEGAELERRIRVFLNDVFTECKDSVAREFTPENLERTVAPVYDKHLTLDDLNELIAFERSPLGRRLKVLLPEAVAEGVITSLEAKGVFRMSPEEMTAKLAQSQRELQKNPSRGVAEILTAAAFIKQLTPDEVGQLNALLKSPFGRKLVEVYPKVQGEIQSNFWTLHGRRVGPMLGETYSRKLKEYAAWLSEATRPGAARGGPPPSFGRLPPPLIVAPPRQSP